MYGKIFSSIYDGTLYGNWEAIATFQQLIVLANADGVVDMTPQAIAARTSFPLDMLLRGIKFLESPDPYSRTPGDDGKRIVLMDPENRPWGWQIVNHGKYKGLRDMEQKRVADKERMAEKRKKNNDVAIESPESPKVAHTYADADANKPPRHNVEFASFWTAYPRKVAKHDAARAFKKLAFINGDFQKVMAALEVAKASEQWAREDGKFIPHAATWLNGRRFEDEANAKTPIKVDL